MKNLTKVLGIIALTAVIGFSIVACGGGGGISGTWVSTEGYEFTFNNGKLKLVQGASVLDTTYTVKGDELIITFPDGGDIEYTFTINGKEMRLTGNGEIAILTKK